MTPPKEYFEQVPEGTPGAQRVGPYWFAFISPDSLYRMLDDGALDAPSKYVWNQLELANNRIQNLEEEVSDLEMSRDEAKGEVLRLETELAELKAKQAEK